MIRFLIPSHIILQIEMLREVLPDDLLFPVRTGIVDNDTDKREICLLHAETLHGILNKGSMVISKTLDGYLEHSLRRSSVIRNGQL